MNCLSDRLVEARKEKDLSQKELAGLLGISATRLNYWEKGKAEPDVSFIHKICDILGVSGDWLIGLSDIKNKPVAGGNKLSDIRSLLINKIYSMDADVLPEILKYAEYVASRYGE